MSDERKTLNKTDILTIINDSMRHFSESENSDYNEHSVIFGVDGILSSISLVSFLLEIEDRLWEMMGLRISLINDRALSSKNNPFENSESLSKFILEMAGEKEASA